MDFEQLEQRRALSPAAGYTPHIGMLVASLEYCRLRTMSKVATLSTYQLDYLQDGHANSIGALLLHMAAVEFVTQRHTFHEQPVFDDPAVLGKWEVPLLMGDRARRAVRDYPVDYYFDEMASVRKHTLEQFRLYDDDWLWHEATWKRGIVSNYYWQWFHVFEDEMGHRGEINWLMSRTPTASSPE